MHFEIGQIIVDQDGDLSIIISKTEYYYTYYLFFSLGWAEHIGKLFTEGQICINHNCKLYEGNRYGA